MVHMTTLLQHCFHIFKDHVPHNPSDFVIKLINTNKIINSVFDAFPVVVPPTLAIVFIVVSPPLSFK